MAKKAKETDVNLFYINRGQVQKERNNDAIKKKKAKEREKRIKQINKSNKDDFDIETETVIQMTNKNNMKKEAEKRKKITQQEKKRQKRNKRIKLVLKIFLLLAIIIGGITFAMISPMFNIKDIEVLNNEQVSAETIISLSELKKEENIFRFNKSKVIKKIKENAYVEGIQIHRKIPNTIQIEIKERLHTYSIDFLGKYAYINKQGYILEISEDSKQKPIIQGAITPEEQFVVGNRLCNEDLEKLEYVIKIIDVSKEYSLDTIVTSIDISNKNDYSIYLEEEKKRVHLGDGSNLSNKMLYINSIIEEEKGKTGDIFVNGDLNNKFKIYFRESLN